MIEFAVLCMVCMPALAVMGFCWGIAQIIRACKGPKEDEVKQDGQRG